MKHPAMLKAVARMVWRDARGGAVIVAFLGVLTALTEGITIGLLIPLAAATQSDMSEQMIDTAWLGGFLEVFNVGLLPLLLLFVGLVIFQATLSFARSYLALRMVQNLGDGLTNAFFGAVSLAKWNAIAQHRMADINQVLSSDITRSMVAVGALFSLFQAATVVVLYMAFAALVSWQMSIFAFVVGATLYAVLFPLRRIAGRFGFELTSLLQKKGHATLDFLNGIRFAKSFLYEESFIARFGEYVSDIRRAILEYSKVKFLATSLFQVGVGVIAAAFVYVAVERFEIGLAQLAVLLIIFARLAPRFGVIQDQSQEFLSQAPAFLNYEALLGDFRAAKELDDKTAEEAPRLCEAIHFERVSMQYDPANEPALDAVSFLIRADRITALIGPSGSGKSTIVDIVSGLMGPTSGNVSVGGTALDDSNRRLWRARVAIVPQDAFLFETSLRENLLLARPDAAEEEIWKVLALAEIDELVRSLPDALDTSVGHRGTRFSGGERQRIAIARALLSDPEILILDEATSSLDRENESKIIDLIRDLGHQNLTVLLVTHNPALTMIADDLIELDSGALKRVERADAT